MAPLFKTWLTWCVKLRGARTNSLFLRQIAPAEIEMVLLQHPGVKEACVLPRADAAAGDLPTAFVVRAANDEGRALTEDGVKGLVAEQLSDYKQLRGGVFFMDKLPQTVTGKIARRELKDLLRAMA